MLSPTLFCLLLSVSIISGHLFTDDRTTRRPEGDPEERRKSQTRIQSRQQRMVGSQDDRVTKLKVFDFSADNDHEPDSNGEFTGATLNVGLFPESFTICSAIMVEAWITEFTSPDFVTLRGDDRYQWGMMQLYAADGYTQYQVRLGPLEMTRTIPTLFFPLQWTQACLSLDSIASKVSVVVDGQLLGEKEYKREEYKSTRPANLSLLLGYYPDSGHEYEVKIADLNVFNSSLSVERMVGLTRAGEEECGAPGDLVSWEEAEWTLHSQAKVIEVDRGDWEGPCRRESKVKLFTADFQYHLDCMQHCDSVY